MKEPTLYVKISSKSPTWKWERCTWKIWLNKNQLFLGNLPLCIKFCPLKEEIPSVKILENYRFHTREKKNPFRENFCLSIRENSDPSVKISSKLPVKEPTVYVKISSKSHTWKLECCTWKIWLNKNQLFLGNLPLCIKFFP